jgi:hypothetical protein
MSGVSSVKEVYGFTVRLHFFLEEENERNEENGNAESIE